MTKSKSTKKALLSSVLALVLTCAMLIGTTFAWFTDSVKSGKNKIVAGNLDVELEYATVGEDGTLQDWKTVEGVDNLFNPDALWEPGHAEVVYLKVRNAGTLALKYNFAMNIASETTAKNVAGEDFKLSQYLKYGVVINRDTAFADRSAAIAAVTEPKALSKVYQETVAMGPNRERYIALVVYMPEEVGNEANYRGDVIPQIDLGLRLRATQFTYEKDSWDNQYDANAQYLEAANYDEINRIIYFSKPGATVHIKLTDDVALNLQQIVVGDGKNLIFDGNGKTITASNMPPYAVFDVQDDGGKIVINDLTIDGSAGSALYFRNAEDVVLNNVTINLEDSTVDKGYPITFYGRGSATMNNVTVTGRTGTYYGNALFDADVFVGAEMNVTINGGDLRSIFVNANRGAAGSITADNGAHIADVRLNQDGGPRATLTQGECTIDLIQDTI